MNASRLSQDLETCKLFCLTAILGPAISSASGISFLLIWLLIVTVKSGDCWIYDY